MANCRVRFFKKIEGWNFDPRSSGFVIILDLQPACMAKSSVPSGGTEVFAMQGVQFPVEENALFLPTSMAAMT